MFNDESLENKTGEPVNQPEPEQITDVPEEPVDSADLNEQPAAEEPVLEENNEPGEPLEEPKAEPAQDSGYEYVFSSGDNAPVKKEEKKKPEKPKKQVALLVTGICLSVVFIFMIAFGIGIISYQYFHSADNKTVTQHATVVVEKAERTGSEYGSAGEDVFSESQVVRMVQDAVVVIESTVQSIDIFGRVATGTTAGSGVIISENGYILTCNHVVTGAINDEGAIKVRLNDQTEFNAVLVGADSASDLAVLKINATGLTYAQHGCSADLIPGERVIAIGNPLGTLGGSVTSGIISATERTITTSDGTTKTLIQTDAAINSGNSGGGLFNMAGQLIGIVNAKGVSVEIEGLAFAIPIDTAFAVEQDLIQYGFVRGVIDDGLSTLDVTAANLATYSWYYGFEKTGIYVVSSKYCEDLEKQDRIVSINGTEVNTTNEWNNYLKKNCKVGDTVTIVAERNGKTFTTTLTLRESVPN